MATVVQTAAFDRGAGRKSIAAPATNDSAAAITARSTPFAGLWIDGVIEVRHRQHSEECRREDSDDDASDDSEHGTDSSAGCHAGKLSPVRAPDKRHDHALPK